MTTINSEVKLELCSNLEWLREFGGYDLADNDQAAEFKSDLFGRLKDAGYEVEWAKWQRSLCHGWNGANTFAHKLGPVGTFCTLTAEQEAEIEAAIDAASTKRNTLCDVCYGDLSIDCPKCRGRSEELIEADNDE